MHISIYVYTYVYVYVYIHVQGGNTCISSTSQYQLHMLILCTYVYSRPLMVWLFCKTQLDWIRKMIENWFEIDSKLIRNWIGLGNRFEIELDQEIRSGCVCVRGAHACACACVHVRTDACMRVHVCLFLFLCVPTSNPTLHPTAPLFPSFSPTPLYKYSLFPPPEPSSKCPSFACATLCHRSPHFCRPPLSPHGQLEKVKGGWKEGLFKQTMMEGHKSAISCLFISGSCLLSGGFDGILKQWDLTSGDMVHTLSLPSSLPLSLSPPLPLSRVCTRALFLCLSPCRSLFFFLSVCLSFSRSLSLSLSLSLLLFVGELCGTFPLANFYTLFLSFSFSLSFFFSFSLSLSVTCSFFHLRFVGRL